MTKKMKKLCGPLYRMHVEYRTSYYVITSDKTVVMHKFTSEMAMHQFISDKTNRLHKLNTSRDLPYCIA